MRLKLDHIELQTPLFIAGTNLGHKLQTNHLKGKLDLYFDTDYRFGIVVMKNKCAIIVDGIGYTLNNPADIGVEVEQEKKTVAAPTQAFTPTTMIRAQAGGPNEVKKSTHTAQVSNPTTEVQNKPGRKPKFQGQESQGE